VFPNASVSDHDSISAGAAGAGLVAAVQPSSASSTSAFASSSQNSGGRSRFSIQPNASPFLIAQNNHSKANQKQMRQSNKKKARPKANPSTTNHAKSAEENALLSGSKAFLTGKKRGVGKGPEKIRAVSSKRTRKAQADPSVVLGPWGRNEDFIVFGEVVKHGTDNVKWNEVAAKIPGRLGRQVRARWYNHLDPSLVWSEFTKAEDAQLIALHGCLNGRWKQISDLMPGRSENQVKNRFNSPLFRIVNDIPPAALRARTGTSSSSSSSTGSQGGASGAVAVGAAVSSEQPGYHHNLSARRVRNSVV
jgi:hypothetical protein